MSLPAQLREIRETMRSLEEQIRVAEADAGRGIALDYLRKARSLQGGAGRLIDSALAAVPKVDELPPWPARWGGRIWVRSGDRPDWIEPNEWVGNLDLIDGKPGYASLASLWRWDRGGYVRLRGDHPHYSRSAAA